MKKKLGDLTLGEAHKLWKGWGDCEHCSLRCEEGDIRLCVDVGKEELNIEVNNEKRIKDFTIREWTTRCRKRCSQGECSTCPFSIADWDLCLKEYPEENLDLIMKIKKEIIAD